METQRQFTAAGKVILTNEIVDGSQRTDFMNARGIQRFFDPFSHALSQRVT